MKTYYLKFKDQKELETVFISAGLAEIKTRTVFSGLDNGEELISFTEYKDTLDVIGLLYEPTGKMLTTDEFTYPELKAKDGWFANFKAELTKDEEIALLNFILPIPITPSRKWLGE